MRVRILIPSFKLASVSVGSGLASSTVDDSVDLEQFCIEVSDFELASKRVKPSA